MSLTTNDLKEIRKVGAVERDAGVEAFLLAKADKQESDL